MVGYARELVASEADLVAVFSDLTEAVLHVVQPFLALNPISPTMTRASAIPRVFWRISTSLVPDVMIPITPETFPRADAPRFFREVRPGHGLVRGDYDESADVARVEHLGVVVNVNRDPPSIEVDWRPVAIRLRPNPSGGQPQWTKSQGYFKFVKSVAERDRLASHFARRFPV
jgi:hypothetical protein